jgi:hypothetical protein
MILQVKGSRFVNSILGLDMVKLFIEFENLELHLRYKW